MCRMRTKSVESHSQTAILPHRFRVYLQFYVSGYMFDLFRRASRESKFVLICIAYIFVVAEFICEMQAV